MSCDKCIYAPMCDKVGEPCGHFRADPVRHGRWIEFVNEDGYLDLRCSLCGEEQHVTFVRFNYCPNCGAKMDGGDA